MLFRSAMTVMLLVLGAMLRFGLLGRRHLLRELDVHQAESLVEAAAERAVVRLGVEPAWRGGSEQVGSEAIVGRGDAEVRVVVEPAGDSCSLRVVVDYPAGLPNSIRRERSFTVALPVIPSRSTPDLSIVPQETIP